MRATIWGCRGTLASPGPETIHYGGQTSCIVLDLDDGSVVILDAGTGIRPYGISLAGVHPPRVDLLITHLHADHIEGLRFFAPFWNPERGVPHLGPAGAGEGVGTAAGTVLRTAVLPGAPLQRAVAAAVPRGARSAVDDRLRDRLGRAREAPGAGRRLPDRGGRPVARVPPRPRARSWDRPPDHGGQLDLGPRHRAGGRRARPRRAVHGVGVRAARRLGSLEHDRCRDVRGAREGRPLRAVPPRPDAHRRGPRGHARGCPRRWSAPARSSWSSATKGRPSRSRRASRRPASQPSANALVADEPMSVPPSILRP